MLIHLMYIYAWLDALVRDLECAARNLIWNGETSKSKLDSMTWKNICKPISEGGLGF